MPKKSERSLKELADAAFREAALTVLERSAKYGTPLIVRENSVPAKVVSKKPSSAKASSKRRPSRKKKP